MNIKVIVWQEDDLWCATVPAFPDCHTWGESIGENLSNLHHTLFIFLVPMVLGNSRQPNCSKTGAY